MNSAAWRVRAKATRSASATNESSVRHGDPVLAGLFQLVAQHQREFQHDGLFHLPAPRPGAVVDSAVAGIDHHHGSRITACFGIDCGSGPARLGRAVLERNRAQERVALGRGKFEHEPVRLPVGCVDGERLFQPRRPGEIDHDARAALHDEAEAECLDQAAAHLSGFGRQLERHLWQIDHHPIRVRQCEGAKIDFPGEVDDEAGLRLVTGEPHVARDRKLGRRAGGRRGRHGALAGAGATDEDSP